MTAPAICQKILSALAPPMTFIFEYVATLKVPVTCMIQISVELPLKVIVLVTVTADTHLYRPGSRISPLRVPPLRLIKSGSGRFAASSYAAIISSTAPVNIVGVGCVKSAA